MKKGQYVAPKQTKDDFWDILFSKLTIILIFFCNILHRTQAAHSLGGLSVLVVHATAATAAAAATTATDPELLHCLCRVVCSVECLVFGFAFVLVFWVLGV